MIKTSGPTRTFIWQGSSETHATQTHVFFTLSQHLFMFPTGEEQISLDDCCKDGQKHANADEDCASIPLISASPTCR